MKDKFKRFQYQRIQFQIRARWNHIKERMTDEDRTILMFLESAMDDYTLYKDKTFIRRFTRRYNQLL